MASPNTTSVVTQASASVLTSAPGVLAKKGATAQAWPFEGGLANGTDRRVDILTAALTCASERGVEGVSIEGVRALCGASVGSIYHHFGSREGVVAALFLALFHDQSRAMAKALAQASNAQEGVHALVTGYLDWVVAHPERARFLFQARSLAVRSLRGGELAQAAQQRNQALVQWFGPHQAAGTLRVLPCELLPSLVMGPVQSCCRAWLSGLAQDPRADGTLRPSPQAFRAELADAAWLVVRA